MIAFTSLTFLKLRPMEPGPAPGKYDWNVPVLERSAKCGRKKVAL